MLCAGPLESLMLLEQSGIGQSEVLSRLGVPQIGESPHVGEHAVEQLVFAYQLRILEQMECNNKLATKCRHPGPPG